MASVNLPLDALASRLNLQGRFDSVRSQSVMNRFANLKPVTEFLNIKALSKPKDFGDMQSRVNYNLSYFSSNYAVVFVMLSIYSLLTNPVLLFDIVLVVGGMFGIGRLQGRDLDVGFARATTSQLYTALLIIAVPLGLWASPIEYSPYDEGRPPGALGSSGRRRRIPQDWELRHPGARYDERVHELESEEDDGQGVRLDANGYAWDDGRQRGFAGDELYFDGYDIGQNRRHRPQVYDYMDGPDSEEDYYRRRGGSPHDQAAREREEVLVQSALERVARARAKGKTNVSLSQEEMQALERRRGQQPEQAPPALASPPATPVAPATPAKKGKVGSRSSSSTSLVTQKTRKNRSTSLFSGQSSPSPAKSNSKAKVDRKPSTEQSLPYTPGNGQPGIMVQGPNGVPVFAPLVNYPPPTPEFMRAQPAGRTRSRSTSKHSRRESTPPERVDPYLQYPPTSRYYPPPTGVRPGSSASNRSLPEDIDWYTPPSKTTRSASNIQYPGYRLADSNNDYDYNTPPPMPAAQGSRRNVSGPLPDTKYASLRRVPPSSSPLAPPRGPPAPTLLHAASDPSGRRSSSLNQEHRSRTSSSSSGESDQGVQVNVNIVPDANGPGYSINRIPVPSSLGTGTVTAGNESRRRKSGRR